jgi:hypothetical protein
MDEPSTNVRPRWRPRFSLLTALLLVAIVAMGIGIWRLYRELVPLRAEVRNLRTQLGVLTIDDDQKFHVVRVREPGGFRWNWRIWLPKGQDYWFCASQKVPAKGITGRQSRTFLGMGGMDGQEINLRVAVVPNENGKRTVYMKGPAADTPLFEVDDTKWLRGETMIGKDVAGEKSQVSSSVDEPLVLLRLSEDPRTSAVQPPNGLLIWISNVQKP